jgi:DNA processing protein
MVLTQDELVVIWLDLFEGLTIKRKYEVLNYYKTSKDLFNNFSKDKNIFNRFIDSTLFAKMSYALDEDFLKKQVMQYEKMNISVVTLNSKNYPKLLKEVATPPLVLYCKGNIELLNTECFAIVGTRRATRYGKKVTNNFTKQLVHNDFTIISGMADGIDTQAHRTALSEGGKTIAVLGGGVNEIYPSSNIGLSKEIVNKGLLISEYKPDQRPVGFHFPVRNRIIAGISSGVLITEGSLKSGSMHTKEYALEANRNLFIVPGNIDSTQSEGCNAVIKSLQGCIVTTPDDILEAYGKTNNYVSHQKKTSFQLSIDEQTIINAIGKHEAHYSHLLEKTNLTSKTLNSLLTTMQVRGIIKKLPGNIYSI